MRFKQSWMLMLRFIINFIIRKEVNEMAVIYATLIIKGKKTYAEVPEKIKQQVKEVLIDLDCADLVTE